MTQCVVPDKAVHALLMTGYCIRSHDGITDFACEGVLSDMSCPLLAGETLPHGVSLNVC